MNKINKIKAISMLLTAMFICVAASSIVGAEVILVGDIETEISEVLGVVKPRINVTNQSATLAVRFDNGSNATDPSDDRYFVNDSLRINLTVIDNSGRESFFLPRFVLALALVTRDVEYRPISSFVERFIVGKLSPLKSGGRIDVTLNDPPDLIIPLNAYEIANATLQGGSESLTLHLAVMGFLPGNVNGLRLLPVIDYKEIEIEVDYAQE